jgi:Protein of unknown function (DUF2911)/Tetratricopeptide repeat
MRVSRSLAAAGLLAASLAALPAVAQPGITQPMASPHSQVQQTIGITQVSIDFHRPRVNERDVWGALVPAGQVWRAGANDNTVISFSTDVEVEGEPLAAGTYGLHMIPDEGSWTVIFSSNSTSWGSFSYTEDEDVLRVTVEPQSAEHQEWLTYGFDDLSAGAATAYLRWEKKKIPFRITVNTPEIVLANARRELRHRPGFGWQGFFQAANWAFNNGLAPEDAAQWVERSVQLQPTANNLGLQARILSRAGKTDEAKATLEQAIEHSNENQLNGLGYAYLLQERDAATAVHLFEANARLHPDSWNVWDSLGEGLAAAGRSAEAIKNYEKALSMAPENQKARIEGAIEQVRAG